MVLSVYQLVLKSRRSRTPTQNRYHQENSQLFTDVVYAFPF